ncbi:hypothetical protein RCG17_11660 [Neobacillus sp. PS3-12]|nr:hypothetical protein [Neobacillus sp. PS3-12]WML55179.1 hypothetical protein RCG17_11660 [Neobacillus sp. PS3-12]
MNAWNQFVRFTFVACELQGFNLANPLLYPTRAKAKSMVAEYAVINM